MLSQELRRIVKENEKYANMLEEYDRTGEFPLDKKRREKAAAPPSGQK
jgi:hypothetical protein